MLSRLLQFLWRGFLLYMTFVMGVAVWEEWLKDRVIRPLEDQLNIAVTYDDGSDQFALASEALYAEHRCFPDFPLKVVVKNLSEQTVWEYSFIVEGRLPNRSTDLVANGYYPSDSVIKPDYVYVECRGLQIVAGTDPRDLTYEASDVLP